jgi:hypothetical protein
MQGDELQAGFDVSYDISSLGAVRMPTSGGLPPTPIGPTFSSVPLAPEVSPGRTATTSGQVVLFTGAASPSVEGARKPVWTVLAGILLFWL